MRTHLKTLVLVAIILGTIFIFAPNKVEANQYATIMSGTVTQEALNNMSDTIKVDLKEIEFEKVPEMIMKQVTAELEKQGIVIGNTYDNSIGNIYVGFQEGKTYTPLSNVAWTHTNCNIHKVVVSINVQNSDVMVNKMFTIEYNNTKNYTETSKSYVANLVKNIDNTTMDVNCSPNVNDGWDSSNDVIDMLNKKINNTTIKFVYNGGTGDFEKQVLDYAVFKDDVYYQDITITSNIYFVTENVKVSENITVDGLIDGTSITVENKENTEMLTEVSKNGYDKIIGSYELKLTGATRLERPIDITFDVGKEFNGKMAYVLHKKADGSYERFEKAIQDGKVTITVSELSPFVIAVKEKAQENNSQTPTTKPEAPDKTPTMNKGEKDDTPKTGTTDIIGYVLGATILSGMGIIALKKRI